MSILDFFPVNEKLNLGKLPNKLIKNTIFGRDNMINLPNNNLEVANNFPWSLTQEAINDIVTPYLNNDFISIIEVGTHIGTTATRFANAIKSNPESYVLCIDTWLTDVSEYILRKDSLNVNMRPGNDHVLFDLFIKNIKNNSLEETVIPFRLPSMQAGQILYYYGLKFDIIYIDASHEYLNVKYDLELYWNLLEKNGTIFGDDYNISGVKRAVDEFVKENNLELIINNGKFFDNIQQITWHIINKI